MDQFWRWLARANASAVLLAMLLGLVCVSLWWASRELFPPTERNVRRAVAVVDEDPELEELNLLGFLDERMSVPAFTGGNPFFHRPPKKPKIVKKPRIPKIEIKIPDFLPTLPKKEVAVVPPPPVPVPKIEEPVDPGPPPAPPAPPLQLTHRGMLKRPDGSIVALIEDSENGSSKFYGRGDTLFGMRVGRIRMRSVEVIEEDGKSTSLPFKKSVEFPGLNYD